jgi:hypothetical protein
MRPWQDRPFETRNLFNPAFCGVVVIRALASYEAAEEAGMPFSLSLLVLPLALHSETRRIFSENPRTQFIKLVAAHPELLVGLAQRTQKLLPFTFEGLGFVMRRGCFTTTANGRLKTLPRAVRARIDGTDDSIECQRAAVTLGRQFARVRDRVTIYTTLGLRP